MPAPDFAAELAEMLEDGVDSLFTPSGQYKPQQHAPPPAHAPRGWNEDDKQFPEVRATCGKSTFPVKERLKALGCKWSQQRNAWVAPSAMVQNMGVQIADVFWQQNPSHDPWTLEGAPQPQQQPPPPAPAPKRPRKKFTVNVDIETTQLEQVSDAFAAMHMAQVIAKADDINLVRELEKRGYVVRKRSTAELLAEEGVSSELLDETRHVFDELDAIESELEEEQ